MPMVGTLAAFDVLILTLWCHNIILKIKMWKNVIQSHIGVLPAHHNVVLGAGQ